MGHYILINGIDEMPFYFMKPYDIAKIHFTTFLTNKSLWLLYAHFRWPSTCKNVCSEPRFGPTPCIVGYTTRHPPLWHPHRWCIHEVPLPAPRVYRTQISWAIRSAGFLDGWA